MSAPPLSLIVLAYDEEENIGPVLQELHAWIDAHAPGAEVLVVDDGSRDGTAEAARRALAGRPGAVISHGRNRGMGAGIKTGTRAARGEWVTFLPADGQIAPEAVGTLLAAAGPDVDLVLSVYEDRDDGPTRKLLSWGVRALITAVHGVRVRSDGPYLFRRGLLDPDQLPPESFFLNFELPIRARRARLRTRTVTIACRPRRAGHSKTARLGRVVDVGRDLVDLRLRRTRDAWRRALGR
ncbi:MAG TPA: glycosyltransferase family 2 protein [Polyangiaceae bacterium LLY-WYZ-15_(1-7)]|nr:hypothetical protein [Myxococcales bacterium]MAT29287.1 hypothetical protein [Sandaracinus sp.]HJL05462.1 glycosyltransferase family 2 protein [Polyangiaceae bacterium LLY-WYZ-15_(1-7)]HJL12801.1 glycosyltransferase family 2 protein [Polyangiaceae bacterium LLY-WYZ-15_(1-7)]HJL25079.1 glycosyltransferase family 2 protein [Polyangiaceae bacterium LLY-WYZ-15_(1-7)]